MVKTGLQQTGRVLKRLCVFLMQRGQSARLRVANNNYYLETLIQQQQQQQPFYPLRHCVLFPARRTTSVNGLYPIQGDWVEIHHFVVPIPRNPPY